MTRNNRIALTLETMLRGRGQVQATNAVLARQLQTSTSTVSTLLGEMERRGQVVRDRKQHTIAWRGTPVAEAPPAKPLRGWTPVGIAVAVLSTMAVLIQLGLNAAHLGSAGDTVLDRALLLATSTLITLLKVSFLTAAHQLWTRRQRGTAALCLTIGLLGLTYDLMAATGYAGAKLADSAAARAALVEQRQTSTGARAAAQRERNGLTARLAGEVQATLDTLGADRDCRLMQPAGRRDQSLPEKRPRNEVECTKKPSALNAELTRAKRIEILDVQLATRETELRDGTALSSADPSAEAVAGLLNWVGGDIASPQGVRRVFLLVIVLVIELAGAFGFGVAAALNRPAA